MHFMKLPISDPVALEHSNKLTKFIRQEMSRENDILNFERFMELALYAPGLGYYSAGQHKLGEFGDFLTAPHISPLFAKSIARQFQQILLEIPDGDILELGAGTGLFAKDLLLELEKLNILPKQYFILEVSADLRERQKKLLVESIPHLIHRIQWLDALPSHKINGIIFANEVLDALPVRLFHINEQGINERCVTWRNNQFAWQFIPADFDFKQKIQPLLQNISKIPYESELNVRLFAWVQSILSVLNAGIILLLDYGYTRAEYYHPDRQMGTLMCFLQHKKHDNPLDLVGLQDITAHVDFTRVIESVSLDECSLAGFTTQADFLLSCGLLSIAEKEISSPLSQYKQAEAIKKLIFPGEMGELIKVMALSKQVSVPLVGFQFKDRRHEL
ncbi:MAG: SAM-dependent methyltransferase [Gammaproteobacteria bacterium]|nr:SAM-dependent methyltransferase [Gammaproteobacteria bacterium]